MPVTGG
ncbi:hypothetical protein E2C01_096952 [Portunus trituberculatus]|nr:hypothetical protein [Portunus trituberculatus]